MMEEKERKRERERERGREMIYLMKSLASSSGGSNRHIIH